MNVLETERLVLRHMEPGDAAFIYELVNEPSWLRFIGDKNVHDLDGARRYMETGPMDSYRRNGFGLYTVLRKEDGERLGMCGLIKRDTLPDADIGFAFLPRYWGKGYAREAAAAVIEHARRDHGMRRLLAITSPDNDNSIRVLEMSGFKLEGLVRLKDDPEEVKLFARDIGG